MLRITFSSLILSLLIMLALTLIGFVVGSLIGMPIELNSYALTSFSVTVFLIVWLAKAINHMEKLPYEDTNQEEE